MQKKVVNLLLSSLLDVYMVAEGVRINAQKVLLIMLVVEKVAVMGQNVIAVKVHRIIIRTIRDGFVSNRSYLIFNILVGDAFFRIES